jgi:hypothetical protein
LRMTHSGSSKFLIPAVVAGCVLTTGLAWRILGSEPTEATAGVDLIVQGVSVAQRPPRTLLRESADLVSVGPMETLHEHQARLAQQNAAKSALVEPEPGVQEGPQEASPGSMELVIQMPSKDQAEGVPLRVVLDNPEGGTAQPEWIGEAELPNGAGSLLLEDLPPATSFRLRVFQGDELYARTTVQASSGSRTTIELNFAENKRQEKAATAALRSIAAAQQQLQASAAIDTDADGGGEFGYFAELAGTQPIRSYAPGGATLDPGGIKLDPTYLPASMGEIEPTSQGGVMIREGYAFMIHLPDDSSDHPYLGIAESVNGGNTPRLPGSSNAEIMWCCYAWPVTPTTPMKKAFMINQAGDVIGTSNGGANPYVGLSSTPTFDAAFSVPGDMGSEPGLAAAGLLSTDRLVWHPAGI